MEHLKLMFVAAKPPPSRVFTEVALMEAEGSGDNDIPYWVFSLRRLPWRDSGPCPASAWSESTSASRILRI